MVEIAEKLQVDTLLIIMTIIFKGLVYSSPFSFPMEFMV